jgi:sigma-E factor negative regulatory protein RseC
MKRGAESTIEHSGIVKKVSAEGIEISLLDVAACSSCHAKGVCSVADTDQKVIHVANAGQALKGGDQVVVSLAAAAGPAALFFGYLAPFIVLMITLVAVWQFTQSEAIAGLSALFSLLPYYLLLLLYRKTLDKKFTFTLSTVSN